MKKILPWMLFLATACSKKNALPAGSTNATVEVNFPDGRIYSTTDYSVKGGTLGYEIDGGVSGSNEPIDYVDDIPSANGSPEYFIYNFKGGKIGEGFTLSFATPPTNSVSNYSEDFSTYPSLSGLVAANFNLLLRDTFFTATMLQVSVSGAPNGNFTITFNLDSVIINNAKVLYPSPGIMTIEGTFNNVSLIN